MKPQTISIAPIAKDIDSFATKQTLAASGFILMTSGAAGVEDADRNAFCLAQTPAGGELTMNGPLRDEQLDIPRVVTIYCTSDISADTYTIRGWAPGNPGVLQTETLAGPNVATVRSSKVYGAVKQVNTDTAATSVVEVGQQGVGTPSEAVRVLITASGNESSIAFTLHGLDRTGKYTTETGSLPNATTVLSVDNYSAIIGLSLACGTASLISVGTASKLESKWVPCDWNADQTMVNVMLSSSFDGDYTVEFTNEDVFATTFTALKQTPTSAYVNTATDGTTTDVSRYTVMTHPVSAVRVAVDPFASGDIEIRITQQRTGY